jgi:hypothetical protein
MHLIPKSLLLKEKGLNSPLSLEERGQGVR